MAEQTQSELAVRVYNRSSRAFIHGKHTLQGGTFAEVPQSVADLWVKLFPLDVVEASVAQKELGGLGAVVAEQKSEIEKLKAELEALKAAKPTKGKPSADV